ncbi:Protein 21.1 [Giardia duodenalis ATCC 50581]|nr:Protein 21.1 [Giardia intestinalis ATCC 50581]
MFASQEQLSQRPCLRTPRPPVYVRVGADTDLVEAAAKGDIEAVEGNLSQAGLRTTNNSTALMSAAMFNQRETVKILREHEAGLVDAFGRTALMIAAMLGHIDCVDLLVNLEGKMQDKEGWTALMYACAHNMCPSDRLVEAEAMLYDNKGSTALQHAISRKNIHAVNKLADREMPLEGITPLMSAAAANATARVIECIEQHSGKSDHNGVTALMYAASAGAEECVRLLLQTGKEARMQDKDGYTALIRATMRNNVKCVKLLAEHEACILDSGGWCALAYAIYAEFTECIKILLPLEYIIRDKGKYSIRNLAKRIRDDETRALLAGDGLQYLISIQYKGKEDLLGVCTICLSDLCIMTCVPCGHRCACIACSEKLVDLNRRNCPMCRAYIEEWKVDLEEFSQMQERK